MLVQWLVVSLILKCVLGRKTMETVSDKRNLFQVWEEDKLIVSEDQKINLVFAIKQSNSKSLDQKLMEVSTPGSALYGKHMTLKQVNEFTQPVPSSLSAVIKFLNEYGVIEYEISSGFLKVKLTVKQTEEMLQTTYKTFVNKRTQAKVIRCLAYSLPDEVADAVDFVAPTVNFPPSRFSVQQNDQAPAAYQNTPSSLRTLYAVDNTQGSDIQSQAVTAFLGQYYRETDLQSFYKSYYPTLSGTPISNVVGPNGAVGGVEAALDVEYMTTLGSGVPTEFWSFAGSQPDNSENEPFLDWLYYLGNTTNPPLVFSTSYGEDEVSVTYDYAVRMNDEFIEAGLRGISIIFASGDSGVGSCFGSCTTYTPQFPSDSPYVTAVGATTGSGVETGASLSSGGFSTRWAQPSYQAKAVSAYLSSAAKLPSSSLYNSSGRAFPDVSAQGTNYVVINNGLTYASVAGTSCSSPVFGGIIGLINDARLKVGKSSMGFLNPFIYKYGSDLFTDVTSGNNPGCGTAGFYASSGWDPVTGFGTPKFDKLLAAALALP